MPTTIDVVIVNWNSGSLLMDCLGALAASDMADRLNVFVVDNASSDGSALVFGTPGLSVAVIANAENRGFAKACNQGATLGRSPYILFLNPDVRVASDALTAASNHLNDRANAATGALGIRLVDTLGRTLRSCSRWPTAAMMLLRTLFIDRLAPSLVPPHFLLEWDHQSTRQVDQVMGAFLLVRRSLFEEINGFDERFFVYYEDADLCQRVILRGFGVVHLASTAAVHLGGGTTASVKDRRMAYEMTSRTQFAAKHHGAPVAALLVFLITAFEIPIRIVHAALTRSLSESAGVLKGTWLFWSGLLRKISFRAKA